MAGDEIYDSVRLRREGVDFTQWPKLSCTEADQLEIDTDTLRVTGAIKATSFQGNGATLEGIVKKEGGAISGALAIQNNLSVAGNLSIGSTNPAAKLHIYASDNDALKITNTTLSKTARMGVDKLGVWIEPSETNSSIRLNANPSLHGLYINGADGKIGVGTINPQASLHVVGNLLGAATKSSTGEALRLAVGSTPSGATNWVQYDTANTGIYVDIDTSSAGFSTAPYYFTNLSGASSHWDTRGATSIYTPTANNFRVYVYIPGTTVAQANVWQWHIQWLAVGN